MRRGRAPFGSGSSFTCIVSGSTRAMELVPNSATYGAPSFPIASPYGSAPGRASGRSANCPVSGFSFPTKPAFSTVNQSVPSFPNASECGSLARGSGSANFEKRPDSGSMYVY